MSGATGPPGHPPAVPMAGSAAVIVSTHRAALTGRAGLAATFASIGLTLTVAAMGPSVMEPSLPGHPGQPPWAANLHPPAWLAVALTAAALAAGTAGLGLCLHAARRGWNVAPRLLLAAGLIAAAALALLPPFGSSDHLSYAAYGRMVVTGHDPYTTTPAALARLGDPVARAVTDWRHTPSVYGSLATASQALASLIGGNSARLTVFVLSVLGVAAFAGTALLLHWQKRGSPQQQRRAALLWACNPLLLQVLVAGEHADSEAIVFSVAAVIGFRFTMPNADGGPSAPRRLAAAAGAGVAVGLAFAVKLSMLLVLAGLMAAAALAWRQPCRGTGRARRRGFGIAAGGLVGGFAVTAAAAFIPWGAGSLRPALQAGSYVSIGSPWRAVRSGLRLLTGEQTADNAVKGAAVVLALALALLLARPLARLASQNRHVPAGVLAPASVLAAVLAWLLAWPYVLPWYDGLAWAMLAMLPWLPSPWASLDWLVLARNAALAFGYLPARGISMPAGLGWLRSVVRTGITPLILLAVLIVMVMLVWPRRAGGAGVPPQPPPSAGR